MTLIELLAYFKQKGVLLWREGSQLRYNAPSGVMEPQHLADLRDHKAALLGVLSSKPPQIEEAQFRSFPEPLGNCETAKLETLDEEDREYTIVRSKLLEGEEIIVARDGVPLTVDKAGRVEGRIVYRKSEIDLLVENNPSPEAVKTIHAIKDMFGGTYTGKWGSR